MVCEADFFGGSSPRRPCSHSLCTIRDGPAVRSDSLVEQRGFELLVLFVGSWRLRKAGSFSEGHCAKADQRIILRAICWQIRAESGWASASFLRRKRPKRTGGSNPLCSSNESVANPRFCWLTSRISWTFPERITRGSRSAIGLNCTIRGVDTTRLIVGKCGPRGWALAVPVLELTYEGGLSR
jgi:hypothetical protein